MPQAPLSLKDQASFLGTWPKWKGGSIRGLRPSPHGDRAGQEDTSLSQEVRQVWQKPAPRAEDGRALACPTSASIPFSGAGAYTHTQIFPEGKFNMFRNTGRGNILGVRKVSQFLTASRRSKPSRISHYKVNRLPASGKLGHRRSISVSLPMDCTSGLGILAADGPVTQDDPGPSSSCKVTPGPMMFGTL